MEQEHFTKAVERLKEVNSVIEGLDERIRADAFEILKPYVVAGIPPSQRAAREDGASGVADARKENEDAGKSGLREFMDEHESHEKPSDNVYAIAAWWYSQYGLTSINKATIEALANEIGVTVSTRSDKTLQNSALSGKKNFRKKGSGFSPKPDGEKWLRETYGVRKGTKQPPTESGEA